MKSNVIKRCCRCGRFLSIDDFYWRDKKKGIKKFNCKKCQKSINVLRNKEEIKQYQKQYRIDNKEKIQQDSKQYQKDNKEKLKIYHKNWYVDNKKEHQEYCKQYAINNKKQLSEYYKRYRKDNPEKKAANNIKYKFLKENQTPVLTEDEQKRVNMLYEIRNLLNHDKVDFHVDHIQPLSKGGIHHPDNLQILPNWLNSEKYNKWPLTEDEQIRYKGFKL